jgi:SAM-dependent methyltransferase
MSKASFDQQFWDRIWEKTLHDHAAIVAKRPPNALLRAEAVLLPPGRALDAGCGHGAESLWLASQGWSVTALDFSATALAQGRAMAEAAGADIARRLSWVQGDLSIWSPLSDAYDLIVCLYVHIAGSETEFVTRLAKGLSVGGTLLLVGHRPFDPSTGLPTAAADQRQISVEGVLAVLDPKHWEILIAEERPRAVPNSGVDAVIRARRIF